MTDFRVKCRFADHRYTMADGVHCAHPTINKPVWSAYCLMTCPLYQGPPRPDAQKVAERFDVRDRLEAKGKVSGEPLPPCRVCGDESRAFCESARHCRGCVRRRKLLSERLRCRAS